MKPRNKKQERILAMSGQLRPLSNTQMQWALNYTINHFAYRLKNGKAVCLKCGHEWNANEGVCRCPHCGISLEVKTTKERVRKDKSYFNIITAKGGYQVIRMFLMSVELRKGMVAEPSFQEIGQYWLDENGNATVVGLKRTIGWYVDSFDYCSKLEIRRDNDAFQFIADQWVYPRIKVTDTIKRNGFDGHTYDINPLTLFKELLTNPKAETLMKSGDVEMLRYLCHSPFNADEIDFYWKSIKVAKRAGFEFEDAQMWMDYIKMLERMGKDLHSPVLVAPQDLKTVHDLYSAKVERQRIKAQREKDRKKAEADEAKFEELKGRYIGLVMTDGEIVIHTLNSVAEYYDEGSRQHICVGSAGYYLKENSLVFTAKIKGQTIATIEISLSDYSIIQCRAFANKVCKYQDRIAKIIKDNTKMIAERKRA
ncbi:PcfJ domain-containing protein [Paramuribaculum intestinale]|uniref:PcfJ domain-containing protein n=1 Tax=Paramuribaculum intestinale TaxID=2094151 RepID=UPI000FFEB50E|nr:PcfJ domain-containing protein [Paramuribaculum intestinale]RXE63496.1 PcfJ-like protein [Muribaculaceae bacterium Isolate-004 (NCI)]